MIAHIVLVKFKSAVSEEQIRGIFAALERIEKDIPGMRQVMSGRSESPEHLERGYLHGFVIHFEGPASLSTYQEHPDHKQLSSELIENASGGIHGILVFDLPFNL